VSESSTFVRFLTGATDIVSGTGHPDAAEAEVELEAIHTLAASVEARHDQVVGCYGPLDHKGRCMDCGRLVMTTTTAHSERGCMMAVPLVGNLLWLVDNVESVPFIGKLIWRRRMTVARRLRSDPSAAGSGR
jgi:hypothetical protein